AGVGRTGQIVAAIAMQKVPNSVSAEEVINDMRYSRNDYMGQTAEQRAVIADLARQQGRSVLALA
ncbi:protein tyrosine phosphatase, partial [Photobacterium damselae]